MPWIEPLDLEALLLGTLAGSSAIFMFLAVLFISALAARFKMPNYVFGICMLLFIILFANYLPALYLIGLLIAGFLTFNIIANMMK